MLNIFLIFDLSSGELFLIVLAIIILFGPKQIPVIARAIGKVMYEVRTATNQIKQEVMTEARSIEEAVQPAGDLSEKATKDNNTADKELHQSEKVPEQEKTTGTVLSDPIVSDNPNPDLSTKKKDS